METLLALRLRNKVLAAVAGVTLAIFGLQNPASASWAQCSSGYMCFWEHASYGGIFWGTPMQNAFGKTCVNLPTNLKDEVSSMGYKRGISSPTDDQIRFFNWDSCNPAGNYATLNANFVPVTDLSCPDFLGSPCNSYYNDNFRSFYFCNHGC